jgi:hypothetical protein
MQTLPENAGVHIICHARGNDPAETGRIGCMYGGIKNGLGPTQIESLCCRGGVGLPSCLGKVAGGLMSKVRTLYGAHVISPFCY